MDPERRSRLPRPVDHLRGAADGSSLVTPETFAALLDGLLDLRVSQAVQPALILAVHPAVADRWELLAAVLMANLREADLLCRLDERTCALALDAGPLAAWAVARRLQDLLRTAFTGERSWVSVAAAPPMVRSGSHLLAIGHRALDEALGDASGAIVAT